MPGPNKVKKLQSYVTSLFFHIVKAESKKRSMSMSDFISNAVYEYIYRPNLTSHLTAPIPKIDRTPKGAPKSSVHTSNFKNVMSELKTKINQGIIKRIEDEKMTYKIVHWIDWNKLDVLKCPYLRHLKIFGDRFERSGIWVALNKDPCEEGLCNRRGCHSFKLSRIVDRNFVILVKEEKENE